MSEKRKELSKEGIKEGVNERSRTFEGIENEGSVEGKRAVCTI